MLTNSFPPLKIISGGQIGADEFGLEVGKELDIETGGTAPPEFQTSDGKQPEKLKAYLFQGQSRQIPCQ